MKKKFHLAGTIISIICLLILLFIQALCFLLLDALQTILGAPIIELLILFISITLISLVALILNFLTFNAINNHDKYIKKKKLIITIIILQFICIGYSLYFGFSSIDYKTILIIIYALLFLIANIFLIVDLIKSKKYIPTTNFEKVNIFNTINQNENLNNENEINNKNERE